MESHSQVITFGCRLNALESEKIRKFLKQNHQSGTIVVNTCAVTAEAERQARQAIRKLRREHPTARIIVTGCSATIHQEIYQKMPEVDTVVGNVNKSDPKAFCSPDVVPIVSAQDEVLTAFEGKARAFLQIQNGCNNACTFCVIRIARGRSVSFPFSKILRQAQEFARQGYQEITLTGVDIASYLLEGRTLGLLVQDLLKNLPPTVYLRLSSLDPAIVDEPLCEALANPRLLPYWHLSLQSGDATVLKRMARRHTSDDLLALARKARSFRPDLLLGADIIVGFPGETETMFLNTCDLVEKVGIAWLHIFPYSDRPGTVATTLTPKIPMQEKKRRLQHLRQIGQKLLNEFMTNLVGKSVIGLVEQASGTCLTGKTEHFLPFEVPSASEKTGQFISFRATGIRTQSGVPTLLGTLES